MVPDPEKLREDVFCGDMTSMKGQGEARLCCSEPWVESSWIEKYQGMGPRSFSQLGSDCEVNNFELQ
jgi:hypothetical protein